jgi:GntR family transcriptional regulator/MocR family aminotransferase
MRYAASLTVPITVTRNSDSPLHQQIAAQLASAVADGLLPDHLQLPSTRTLASALGVSRGVATAAYESLFARGYLVGERGSGTYVARPVAQAAPAPRPAIEPVDLRPGLLNTEAFPLAAWRSAWRQASFRCPPPGRLPALGLPELRQAVGEYLTNTRGTPLAGREVVVTGGRTHALRLVLDVLGLSGGQVAIEEPTAPEIHQLLRSDGRSEAVALPVDAYGAVVATAPAGCRALVFHPDSSVPFGYRLSADRHREALAGGRRLIEMTSTPGRQATVAQCGDSVFADRSILIGGFCELFGPSLNLAYALLPRDVADAVGRRVADHAEQPPHVTQLAVAALLRDGTARRIARRLGRRYTARTDLLKAALQVHANRGTAVALLTAESDADGMCAELLDAGVRVGTLRPYYFSGRTVPAGIVFGYGHVPDATLRRVLPVLRRVLHRAEPGPTCAARRLDPAMLPVNTR